MDRRGQPHSTEFVASYLAAIENAGRTAAESEIYPRSRAHPTGVELSGDSSKETAISAQGGAIGGAQFGVADPNPRLAGWRYACPIPLTDAKWTAIVAIVQTAE